MKEKTYPHELVARIAPSIAPKTVANWASRGLMYSAMDQPGHGRARRFSRANLVEFAIAASMNASGFTREHSVQAFKRRATYRKASGFIGDDTASGYPKTAEELFAKAAELKPGSRGCHWALFNTADPNEPKDRGHIVACVPFTGSDADEIFKTYSDNTFTILPVSHIVSLVDAEIARWEAEND